MVVDEQPKSNILVLYEYNEGREWNEEENHRKEFRDLNLG